jgi:hypothetical protein
LCAVFVTAVLAAVIGCTPTPKTFDPPQKTEWTPEGCRPVPSEESALPSRTSFRTLHSDTLNSDEVSNALTPVFEFEWVAEPDMYVTEGPSFDNEGNLYFCPWWPGEEVILVSLDPDTGARRWAIPHAGRPNNGGGTPLVLDDPANPGEQIIYISVYDRALAVKPDGTLLWDKTTGLPTVTPADDLTDTHCFGLNYDPQSDALVGATGDGNLFALDRATGDPLLASPHQLPGERSPSADALDLPQSIIDNANQELAPLLAGLPPGSDPLQTLVEVLLGGDKEVANYFSVDPRTGRIWVAATAPDAEDGTVDGVSENGALYALELVPNGGATYTLVESCHRYFQGGTASTPGLRADGSRVYVGDANGMLIALDDACNELWSLDVGAQITGSVAVASDNGELYLPMLLDVVKVVDRGSYGEEVWRAQKEAYTPGLGHEHFSLCTATIGANGVLIQVGVGPVLSGGGGQTYPLPFSVGAVLLDRETGAIRYFADGLEEAVSVMSTGPDGALYIGHSPVRRTVTRAVFGSLTHPIVGGVGKYAPHRLDLQIRDAVCAAAARALNAHANAGTCPDAAEADIRQIGCLIDQSRTVSAQAISDGDLASSDWATLDGYLTDAEANLSLATLDVAAGHLQQACDFFP